MKRIIVFSSESGIVYQIYMSKIKDLPRIERPREKLERYGPEKLSHAELLAIILRSGQKQFNVIELSW